MLNNLDFLIMMQFVSSLNINFSWQVDAILLPLIFFSYLLECFTGALSEIRIYCKAKEITVNQIT